MTKPAAAAPASDKPERRRKFRLSLRSISLVSIFGVLLFWYAVTALKLVDSFFLPSPGAVWNAFDEMLKEGYKGTPLYEHVYVSLIRLFVALALAIVTAVPLGLISGYSKILYAILDPFIQFYRPLPPLAYYTLLVLWLGIEDTSKIALLYLAAFAPLYLAAVVGVQRVPKDRIHAALSLGASKLKVFMYVILPSTLPEIYTGLRTAVGFTFTTLVAAEMVAAASGIGWMVLDASKFLRSDIIFVGIILMGVLAMGMDQLILLLQKKHVPWIGKE
jgi:taurine transport system permease protein